MIKTHLEELLKEQPLKNSRHDTLIKKLSFRFNELPNLTEEWKSAYYKIGGFEGDIDYMPILFGDKLMIFEVKSKDTAKNYYKAKTQLKKSKSLIKTYTDFTHIQTYYGFFTNPKGQTSFFRYERI